MTHKIEGIINTYTNLDTLNNKPSHGYMVVQNRDWGIILCHIDYSKDQWGWLRGWEIKRIKNQEIKIINQKIHIEIAEGLFV